MRVPLPDLASALLQHLLNEAQRVYENATQKDWGRGWDDNAEFGALLPDLCYRPYDWRFEGEYEERPPNLEFGGVPIWWYKHPGRGDETDRRMGADEWDGWYCRALDYLHRIESEESGVRFIAAEPCG